ncbi:TPA: BCCT family transporter [Clostridium botulinum]|uniref:BCCT family transporter n=1 Tax=Clostridium botulinum TaxID=1491 RepID=UPI0008FC8DAE|nr:BCCT family transporter [Clostridium botulinum]APC80004.1 transporter, betaine/carnitine/choline transporter family protein [Clostridium botulinum]MCS4445892.1 BCCT family transporter [Clostridium botulinum]MCS4456829.1 BCCT family transporter [Clostridium botulinum]MCS4461380.1 BCCT family transporter [Clostridium botulinum]MCS4515382.1 BCCT family transporter [Clostridium botulinum]
MIKKLKKEKVFYVSIISLLFLLLLAFFNIDAFAKSTKNILNFLLDRFSWFYILVMLSFFIFCMWAAFSKYGKLKLGKDNEDPEYSLISWFTMLFSAGMGIGLIFWGVAEPLNHYIHPFNLQGFTEEAKTFAMTKSFLHWGISAWSCYAILALALTYFQFRKGKPALMSSLLIPLIGEKKASGWIGNTIDIFTIFATVAGVITSLGLGALQINAGLNYLLNIPENIKVQLIIIILVTICFIASASSGLNKGIQTLSNLNMLLAAVLLIFVILTGPSLEMNKNLFKGLGVYAKELLIDNNNIFVTGDWYKKWTIFYWGWWIAWAPPVGIFIARISKGRTIKEFLLGVLFVPSIICFIWFAVFGTMGFNVSHTVALTAIKRSETAFFVVMNEYNFGYIISLIAIMLLGTFFVTSADSATFVLGMLSSNGDLNPKTSKKFIWGVLQASLTIVFLLAGGLDMIQTVSIIAAFPFAFIMIIAMISLRKSLKNESLEIPSLSNNKKIEKVI